MKQLQQVLLLVNSFRAGDPKARLLGITFKQSGSMGELRGKSCGLLLRSSCARRLHP